jgi:hypothetical protein
MYARPRGSCRLPGADLRSRLAERRSSRLRSFPLCASHTGDWPRGIAKSDRRQVRLRASARSFWLCEPGITSCSRGRRRLSSASSSWLLEHLRAHRYLSRAGSLARDREAAEVLARVGSEPRHVRRAGFAEDPRTCRGQWASIRPLPTLIGGG